MYEYISGRLKELNHAHAVLDVGGVGYKILVPVSYLGRGLALEEKVQLFVSFVVREMSQTFFGFLSTQERDLFEILLAVSGIGPKTALAVIGHLGAEGVAAAVQGQNLVAFSKVPGIGKKTAERMLIELKNKLEKINLLEIQSVTVPSSGKLQDALSALMNLGYSQAHSEKAVKEAAETLGEACTLSDLIAKSLKV